ncbi:uncharacterized protein LOC108149995 [Drosophila elegans]|uniref:uncharacterized protein LOC108149995 n=1 Tax=Drosophila elegans TaxID=30023 RepID=UPI0007E767C9|nr:uncharacterized protein LOC108149995 [Drosophila elegans]
MTSMSLLITIYVSMVIGGICNVDGRHCSNRREFFNYDDERSVFDDKPAFKNLDGDKYYEDLQFGIHWQPQYGNDEDPMDEPLDADDLDPMDLDNGFIGRKRRAKSSQHRVHVGQEKRKKLRQARQIDFDEEDEHQH